MNTKIIVFAQKMKFVPNAYILEIFVRKYIVHNAIHIIPPLPLKKCQLFENFEMVFHRIRNLWNYFVYTF